MVANCLEVGGDCEGIRHFKNKQSLFINRQSRVRKVLLEED